MFQRLKSCNEESIERTGSIDVSALSNILGAALQDERTQAAILIGLAHFIGYALDGTVVEMVAWSPPSPPSS